jgi:hypothetical protein
MANGVSKTQKFCLSILILKNVHLTLVKSAPKKVLTKELIFLGPISLAKTFLGALFTDVICSFLKSA